MNYLVMIFILNKGFGIDVAYISPAFYYVFVSSLCPSLLGNILFMSSNNWSCPCASFPIRLCPCLCVPELYLLCPFVCPSDQLASFNFHSNIGLFLQLFSSLCLLRCGNNLLCNDVSHHLAKCD